MENNLTSNAAGPSIPKWTRIIRPTIVNEVSFGYFTEPEDNFYKEEELQKISPESRGVQRGSVQRRHQRHRAIPNATFGGVPTAANLTIEGRFPLRSRYYIIHGADNFTAIRGSHTIKAGVDIERFTRSMAKTGTVFNGAFNFQNNTTNPLNTGYAYSNAVLGNFYSYTQSTSRNYFHERDWDEEAFVQDNWKATRRLTVDFGMRLYWIRPTTEDDNRISGLIFDQYDASKGVKLYPAGHERESASRRRPDHRHCLLRHSHRRARSGFRESVQRNGVRGKFRLAAELAGEGSRRAMGSAIRLRL